MSIRRSAAKELSRREAPFEDEKLCKPNMFAFQLISGCFLIELAY